MEKLKVFLVEDEVIIRNGVKKVLTGTKKATSLPGKQATGSLPTQ